MKFVVRSGKREAPSLPNKGSGLARVQAFVIVMLACLLAQGTAVQSHLHLARQAAPLVGASQNGNAALSQPSQGEPAADCALCHEAAMAGAYVLPPVIVLPPPPPALLLIGAAAMENFRLLAPARGWLSRAPPQ